MSEPTGDPRAHLQAIVAHLPHILPGQAPIKNFVHHNTLHGYQHLPFEQALEALEQATGVRAWPTDAEGRALYARGAVTDPDLEAALADRPWLRRAEVLVSAAGRVVTRGEVLRIALLHGADALAAGTLHWHLAELGGDSAWQDDVPEGTRRGLLEAAARRGGGVGEPGPRRVRAVVGDLWRSCLDVLGVSVTAIHPEALADLTPSVAAALGGLDPAVDHGAEAVHGRMDADTRRRLDALFDDPNHSGTSLLRVLTGRDLHGMVRPVLVRFLAAFLDEGLAPWRLPGREQGLYAVWRQETRWDLGLDLDGVPAWRKAYAALPDDPVDAVYAELRRLGLPPDRWEPYLRRVALELPGWFGMLAWRQAHPDHLPGVPVSLMEGLAIRLFLDGLWIRRTIGEIWGVPGSLKALRAHLHAHLAEAHVRLARGQPGLPDDLARRAELLCEGGPSVVLDRWQELADRVWTWELSPASGRAAGHTAHQSAWRLFRLAQHLGLCGPAVRDLGRSQAELLLGALDAISPQLRGTIWQEAREHHYRAALLAGLQANAGRAEAHVAAASAQVICCIDDREEAFRRHLEEDSPDVETYGAAGFFGLAIAYQGLDDPGLTPLCPVVVRPAHRVTEQARPGVDLDDHRQRQSRLIALRRLLWRARSGGLWGALGQLLLAPVAVLDLVARLVAPTAAGRGLHAVARRLVPPVPTALAVVAAEPAPPASPEAPRLGYTLPEQIERVAALLRSIGLVERFAPVVVLLGHGSGSLNNPHLAAYDCGACSGRHGGPNARAFAASANRPEVRAGLRERGIDVPDSTRFIGAEHHTADESVIAMDLEDRPAASREAWDRAHAALLRAAAGSAQERCRRFASAPPTPTPLAALRHVIARAWDPSQARPELGHATNAAAIVGRRALSRGLFLDRRAFLVSYDPEVDADGHILENILLAAGPVGAGINLEYYFSALSPDLLGCGTKVPHNVTGLFAVMEGTTSDLRTGLPRQMTEIHDPVRLQLVVEASPARLEAILGRQPGLDELFSGGWVHLIARDPAGGALHLWAERGWRPWTAPAQPPPRAASSLSWVADRTDPLPPALLGAHA